MLNIISELSIKGVATTYIANVRNNNKMLIEFVDSTPPPESDREKKWVIIVSSQIGCALGCKFCDASNYFYGNLKKDEIIEQVNYIIQQSINLNPNKVKKFKIQFARMGEPSLNPDVVDAMLELLRLYPSYIPCIATTAPIGSEKFFEKLLKIKDSFMDFQLQFSINSTDIKYRDSIMPFLKLPFKWITDYSERFYSAGKRKIVLNFAVDMEQGLDYELIKNYFNPQKNIIKLTPINPTINSYRNGFRINLKYDEIGSLLKKHSEKFCELGFETIISIGDMRENVVLSNCGQIASYYQKHTESSGIQIPKQHF